MSNNKTHKSSILQSAKARLVFAVMVVVVILISVIFYIDYRRHGGLETQGTADVSNAPDITAIPGAGSPSTQYVSQQNLQNRLEAVQARKTATAAVPTITRPSFIGDPSQFGQLQQPVVTDTTGAITPALRCPIKRVVVMYRPNPASCTLENLRLARDAGVTAEELVCQGCACPLLRTVGYTAGDFKTIGYTATQLHQCGFTLDQLMQAGFSAADLKEAGFSAAQLANAGFTAGQLAAAGFSPGDIAKAGYTPAQLAAAGISPDGLADCSISALQKARADGATAEQLRARGCGVAALKAAGFTAAELRAAGFTAKELADAGFSAADLARAGYTPAEIRASEDLKGYCSAEHLKSLRAAGVSALEIKNHGCSLTDLKAAGFTAAELKAAGFTAGELKAAGFSAAELKAAGFTAAELKAAGFTATELKTAGFNAADLKAAGFTAGDLRNAGFSASDIKNAGFTAAQMRAAGFSAADLKAAGFTSGQLHEAGYTKGDLVRAGFTPQQAGYVVPPPEVSTALGVQPPLAQAPVPAPAPAPSDVLETIPSVDTSTPEGKLAAMQRKEQQQMNAQQRSDAVQQMQGAMTLQAQKMLAGWSNVRTQSYVQAPATVASSQTGNGAGGANGQGSAAAVSGPIIKAGTVMYAVLETSINSDERSPIMAHIVTGSLAGAKLLGQFSRVDKKLLLTFHLLNAPCYQKSVTINAVAIDPDTARTAIAGQVNNHYLLRYGTLFASAFLQGLSNAVLQSGTTQNCFFGLCTTTQTPLKLSEQITVGFGKVGERYADVMGNNFTRPPTIQIGAGTGLGILFMSDLTLPANHTQMSHQALPAG